MQNSGREKAFAQVAAMLPQTLRVQVESIPQRAQTLCEELRLRVGSGIHYCIAGDETALPDSHVSGEDLRELLARATRYSVHSFSESLRNGYVTIAGGHRIGLCGDAILREGMLAGFRELSSVNMRIACPQYGVATKAVLQALRDDVGLHSTLLVSPPVWGKTTLLRDCIRSLSRTGVRVAVADERCEIGAVAGGVPQFDLGPMTDIISSCPKAEAAMLLVKTMSPMLLALDELTASEDIRAAIYAAHCGVRVLATAHAEDYDDFRRRPLYRALTKNRIFEHIVEIRLQDGVRSYRIRETGGEKQ